MNPAVISEAAAGRRLAPRAGHQGIRQRYYAAKPCIIQYFMQIYRNTVSYTHLIQALAKLGESLGEGGAPGDAASGGDSDGSLSLIHI